ncbi:MAG: PhzF family phenazine biosynthesis protein [Pseudomonadota bacterium]
MSSIQFKQVDVFTALRFQGNPVAVVLQADGMSAERMQQIARWTNLSETTFVVAPTDPRADYHVRIFTPGGELPFAGHPTIGTAHALLEAGMIEAHDGVLTQQCAAGLIRLDVTHAIDGTRWIHFELPEPKISALDADEIAELEAILGVSLALAAPCLVDVGPRWVVAQLPSARAVLEMQPDLQRMKRQDDQGRHAGVVVFGEHEADAPARIEVRAFAPAHGIGEDPVCGSGNGSVAAFIRHTDQTGRFGTDFLSAQGRVLGRAGVLRLIVGVASIQVGGNAVTCIDGQLSI